MSMSKFACIVLLWFFYNILKINCESLIDNDTHNQYYHISSYNNINQIYDLVMSDEFNVDNRAFDKDSDKLFEAIQKPDNTNEAIQFYNSSREYVTTKDGNLMITTRAIKTSWIEWDHDALVPVERTKNYTSGMIQSWNKFCFTGGILEMSIELPGKSDSGGLWPAAWLMGNLGRATFEKSTMHIWPWSYNQCKENEHDILRYKQEINACDDHPGYGLHPNQGRGSPEIDIFEVMPGHEMPGSGDVQAFMSSSLQISPGISKNDPHRPKNGHDLNNTSDEWYTNIKMSKNSKYNSGFWGQECGPEHDYSKEHLFKYMEDAISVNTNLDPTHFDKQHIYRIEWQPGPNGYLYWYLDNNLILGIDGESLQQRTGAIIPNEPMYLIFNTAISHRWGMPEPCPSNECSVCWHCYDCTNPDCQCTLPNGMKNCRNLPASMKIDYIRLYQNPNDPSHTLSCSPDNYPTKEFINQHIERYVDWQPMNNDSQQLYWFVRYTTLSSSLIIGWFIVLFLIYKIRISVSDQNKIHRNMNITQLANDNNKERSLQEHIELKSIKNYNSI